MHGAGRDIQEFTKSLKECRDFVDESCWDLEDFMGKHIPILDADPWQSSGGVLRPIIREGENPFHIQNEIPLYFRYRYTGFSNGGGFLYVIFISPKSWRYAN